MSSEHRPEFSQTKKFAFQYIPLGIANDGSFVFANSALTVEAVELFVGAKEIIRIAINIPDPFDWLNYKNFLGHLVEKVS